MLKLLKLAARALNWTIDITYAAVVWLWKLGS